MEYAAIPSTGARVSRIGIGTWNGFDAGNDAARRAELSATLGAFFANGGNLIDTSPMYGSAERVMGDLLAKIQTPAHPWIATKVWITGSDAGIQQMNESHRLLRAEQIDLMQVHNLLDWRTHMKTLRVLKSAGSVKHIGLTHYEASAHEDVRRVYLKEKVDAVQLNLSLREPEAAPIAAECEQRGIAFIANRPFGGGGALRHVLGKPLPGWCAEREIHSWAQFMLKWVLAHPGVTTAIPGTSKSEHIVNNMVAADGWMPDAADRTRMASDWKSAL
jgi:diketogulonate reductase-like aldo/keto reductase